MFDVIGGAAVSYSRSQLRDSCFAGKIVEDIPGLTLREVAQVLDAHQEDDEVLGALIYRESEI